FYKKSPPGRRRQKIYKTGDLGRWLADGNLEFLGRMDDQVKIRGYRIELGEIEAQLLRHETVQKVVVTANDTGTGDKILCAYIVPGTVDAFDKPSLFSEELKRYLS
ncbi:MAG: AMP-binding protein, partial [Candidatus Aminicenantes bacterium]|nr:AMP-binding protein [Candidatus Aminicenantes bacterium]NIM82280.1 AMP-binding protein [Candidatus Aminicenantes bacterium]NIN21662.1 AMP-binding protein [Candidatus Aminicenantes bacterium]NIN45457.1 AMP-binding protein [Candidatus Aminicenantes bacterium]NIN88289.1 AMP-binding protein [Candidatus Aminicenantes bacterium]